MKVRRVQIEQQRAQLKIDSQMASLSIDMPIRRMKVEQRSAEMSVETEPARVKLDMEDFKNKIGIKSIYKLIDESSAQAIAHASEAIKEISNDGYFVGALPSNGNPIAELNRMKMLKVEEPKLYNGNVPDGTIKMEGTPGDIQIDWSSHEVKIIWDEYQTPSITVEPKASVNVELSPKPSIEFTVVEQTIPKESGRIVDTEV